MRSIWKKFGSLIDDFEDRSASISIVNEIWLEEENKEHCKAIEEMYQMRNISFVNKPRPTKRGEGVGFITQSSNPNFQFKRLDVKVPKNIECIWGMSKTTTPGVPVTKIIF